ncbi:MAG: Fic family protein [Gemmatimonadetes bacterium]|nr:Fic family protein [Gemmatimonadota bacterium]
MKRGIQGQLRRQNVRGEPYSTFVPQPLPPKPELSLGSELHDLLEQANRALGRLDGLTLLLPDRWLFLYFYVRKEAVLSSQIEGTQSSLAELLLFETEELPGVPFDDVQEVSRYVAALEHGLARLREGFPLSLRLIREIHGVLLGGGRGSEKTPGEFRKSQNWVGGSRPGNAVYVPPAWEGVTGHMGDLEKFLHDTGGRTPTLIKAALSHVQFETIHPFQDGNGRLGRLLITFLLCAENALSEPLLYLSLHFKRNRERYYDLLQRVRLEGDWEEWLAFFLNGVLETADQATGTARRILDLFEHDRSRLESLGRSAGSALRLHYLMRRHPLISAARTSRELKLSPPTVGSALRKLEDLGIIHEVTGRRRNRFFAYTEYFAILNEGAEPIGRQETAPIATGGTT